MGPRLPHTVELLLCSCGLSFAQTSSIHLRTTLGVQCTWEVATSAVISAGGTSCIANYQTVLVRDRGAQPIAALMAGDMIQTGDGYQPYLGSMHDAGKAPMLVLELAHGQSVELSREHLIKTKAGFVSAATIDVGSLVATVSEDGQETLQPVLRIAAGSSRVAAPLTRSGTIVVHGVVLSCHAIVRSHAVANAVMAPVRLGVVKDLHAYVRALVWLYNRLPGPAKALITAEGWPVL